MSILTTSVSGSAELWLARPATNTPPTLSTGDPSYLVAASTSGSARPTFLTTFEHGRSRRSRLSTPSSRPRPDCLLLPPGHWCRIGVEPAAFADIPGNLRANRDGGGRSLPQVGILSRGPWHETDLAGLVQPLEHRVNGRRDRWRKSTGRRRCQATGRGLRPASAAGRCAARVGRHRSVRAEQSASCPGDATAWQWFARAQPDGRQSCGAVRRGSRTP